MPKTRKKNTSVPIEDQEQRMLVKWLREEGIIFTHISNSTYTESWSVKNRNKALGVAKGVPDLMIVLDNKLVFIELKRSKKSLSNVSPEQKEWIERLDAIPNVYGFICYGCEESKEVIKELL